MSQFRRVYSIPTKKAINKLANVYRRWKKEQLEVSDLLQKTFPVGSEVFYQHGEVLRFVTVTRHCYGLDLFVKGVTGTEYRIGGYRVIDAMADRGI